MRTFIDLRVSSQVWWYFEEVMLRSILAKFPITISPPRKLRISFLGMNIVLEMDLRLTRRHPNGVNKDKEPSGRDVPPYRSPQVISSHWLSILPMLMVIKRPEDHGLNENPNLHGFVTSPSSNTRLKHPGLPQMPSDDKSDA